MALVHWPERKYLAPCREPVDFKRNLIALFLQSKYRAITRGQLCSPLFCNLVSNKRLQMPQAKGFRYSAQWWSYILCFFHVMLVLFTLRVSYSNFVFFSILMGQKGINNLNFNFFFFFFFCFHLGQHFSGWFYNCNICSLLNKNKIKKILGSHSFLMREMKKKTQQRPEGKGGLFIAIHS